MLTGGFSRRGLEDEPTKDLRLQAWLDDKFAFSPSLCPPSLTPSLPPLLAMLGSGLAEGAPGPGRRQFD